MLNATALLATPPTVTKTLPVVAPLGTGTAMLASFQLVVVAATPLNVTVLVPCVDPKPMPAIVTDSPTAPDVGDRLVMVGAANDALSDATHKMTRTTSCHCCHFLFMVRSLPSFLRLVTTDETFRRRQLQRSAVTTYGAGGRGMKKGYVTVIASAPPALDDVTPLAWPS